MNKKIKFLISLLLTIAAVLSMVSIPASSFTNDVETSSSDMLLVNLDTHTTVYSQKQSTMWYSGYLAELTTFLVAYELIKEPEKVKYEVKQSFIDALHYSDGCLKPFVGKTITARDLMAIMLLTSGNDAAYALADIACDNDREKFVSLMNEKASALGCTDTEYINPGFSNDSAQHTTCRDLYRIYMAVDNNAFYNKVMSDNAYTPEGLSGGDFTVTSEASIMNSKSPYYFKYVNDAKYSYHKDTYAGIVLTTTYRGQSYFFAALLGKNESERNVYADARKLTTWAYLNLSDRKVIDNSDSIARVSVDTGWGEYEKELYSFNSAYKTLPKDFDELLLSYTLDIPEKAKWPLFKGQSIGSATVTYDKEDIDKVELVIDSDEGVSLLADTARFADYAFSHLLEMPDEDETAGTEELE